jgi:AraC family transcriptional regulator, ethanolamine operon transcriptional activator
MGLISASHRAVVSVVQIWYLRFFFGPTVLRFLAVGRVSVLAMSLVASNSRATIVPERRTLRYDDVEAQATSQPGHEQLYSQLTSGRFEGTLDSYVISPRVALFVEATNRSIRKQFSVLPEHLRIGFLVDEAGQFKCYGNGAQLGGGDASVNLPMTPLDMHFGENYRGSWITLDYEHVRRMMLEDKQPSRRPGRLQVADWAGGLFRDTLATAQQELFKPGAPRPHASTVAAFEKFLFSIAAWTLSTALGYNGQVRRPNVAHRAQLLRKACEIIDGKLTDGLTMSELCWMIGTSRRTLENIFMEAFNVSPYQYVRTMRLNAIRKALLSAENASISIGEVASRWGIWHLSRFAADYRSIFGELPSETRQSRP